MIKRIKCEEISEGPDKGMLSITIICNPEVSRQLFGYLTMIASTGRALDQVSGLIKQSLEAATAGKK